MFTSFDYNENNFLMHGKLGKLEEINYEVDSNNSFK